MSERVYFRPPQRHRYFVDQLLQGFSTEAVAQHQHATALIEAVGAATRGCASQYELEGLLQSAVPLLQAEAVEIWKGDILAYEALALEDFERDAADFAALMSRGDTNLFYDGTIATHFNWADPRFNATIAPSSPDFAELRISISGGVMRSLDDLFFRAFCNTDFFSWSARDDAKKWQGCACYFAAGLANPLKPAARYWVYQPDMQAFLSAAVSGETPFLGVLPNYYGGLPVGDAERLGAASLASTAAFFWVYAHEVAHYRRGHFHALSEHPHWFGIDGATLDHATHLWMVEGGHAHSAIVDTAMSRQIEWDADRVAAEAIVDIFFHPDQAAKLPGYCEGDARWLLRLLIISMAGAALIMDRIAQIAGNSTEHPTALARVVGIIIAACRRFDQTVNDGPVSDSTIRAFAKIGTREDAISFASQAVSETLEDCLVLAEILENETREGVPGAGYEMPLGEAAGETIYLHHKVLTTMFKESLKSVFEPLQAEASTPTGRWSDAVFAEVKRHLDNEMDHPLSAELNRYTAEIHHLHERKLASMRGGS
jgi:hypothetical protein